MKNVFYLFLVLLAIGILAGCQKQADAPAPATVQLAQDADFQVSATEPDIQGYHASVAANEARLESLGLNSSRDCMGMIDVPADYATIQEAVDAACDSAKITVAAGTYEEIVYLYKPGLKLIADGEAIVNGGFYLEETAGGTSIDGFTININTDFGTSMGIQSFDADHLVITNNNITGGGWGMLLWNMSHSKIEYNVVQNGNWGILIAAFDENKADYNKVANNTVTGVTNASGIGLQGDCGYNAIHNNEVTDCPMSSNAGIFLFSYEDRACNNNSVKGNNSSRNGGPSAFGGFGMGPMWGYDNSIGPFNTFNENNQAGVYIMAGSYGNDIFKNEILNNVDCDIIDLSGGMNNYNKNDFDCFSDGSE